ncbi:MAG: hypothetical protein OEY86_15500 [Nitrospira sp.]|nr:hypothetical protein [Nitrospira sp.]
MPASTLALLLIVLTFGCASPGTSSSSHTVEPQQQACLSLADVDADTESASLVCRSEPQFLERVTNALGGFAAAMRDPNQ